MTFSLDVFDWLRVEGFYITSNFIEERTVNPLELFKLLRFFFLSPETPGGVGSLRVSALKRFESFLLKAQVSQVADEC